MQCIAIYILTIFKHIPWISDFKSRFAIYKCFLNNIIIIIENNTFVIKIVIIEINKIFKLLSSSNKITLKIKIMTNHVYIYIYIYKKQYLQNAYDKSKLYNYFS